MQKRHVEGIGLITTKLGLGDGLGPGNGLTCMYARSLGGEMIGRRVRIRREGKGVLPVHGVR